MPRYTAAPRASRRRSCLRATCCCLFLVGAVIFVGLNLAQILASEIELQKELRAMWKKYGLEHHPDKRAFTTLTLEEAEDYIQKQKIFETLLNGRLRCEYDRKHRIKGRWQATTCREAFRGQYRELLLEEFEMVRDKQEAAAAANSGDRKVKVKVEAKQQKPLTNEPGMKASPQARPAVPLVTVDLGPEPENRVPGVDSIPGYKTLKSGVANVWTYGLVHSWIQLKALAADCHEKLSPALTYFVNIWMR